MANSNNATRVNEDNQSVHSKHLIKRGNIVFLPKTSTSKTVKSAFLIKKNQLEYPVLIKVYNPLENKYLHQDNFCLRLEILKIHHAVHKNDPFALYIDKPHLNEFIETVKRQSCNSWQVEKISYKC